MTLALAVILLAMPAASAQNSVKEGRKGTAIVTRAVDAMGGALLVDRVLTIAVVANAKRITPNGTLNTPTRSFVEFPASFRHEIEINGKKIAMASSPEGAFLIGENTVQPLSDPQRQNLEVTALRNPLVMVKGRKQSLFGADFAGEGYVGSAAVDLVDIFVGNEQFRIAVEKSTGRILQEEFDTRGGQPEHAGRMVVTFSDFRRIEYGLTLPFKSVGRFDDQMAYESQIESIAINEKLSEALFGPDSSSVNADLRTPPVKR